MVHTGMLNTMNLTEADNNRVFMSEGLENRLITSETVSRMQLIVTSGNSLWSYDVEHVTKKCNGKYEITCLGDKPNQCLFEVEQAGFILSVDDETLVDNRFEIAELAVQHSCAYNNKIKWKHVFKLRPVNKVTGT